MSTQKIWREDIHQCATLSVGNKDFHLFEMKKKKTKLLGSPEKQKEEKPYG